MSNATITRRASDVPSIDLFCGFGGSSQGIHTAGANLILAANHDDHNLDVHAANWPDVEHIQADFSDREQPTLINKAGKKVSGIYMDPANLPPCEFMWASPSCKFHSLANAKKLYAKGPQASLFGDEDDFDHVAYANSERSRVTMLCPLRYAARHLPRIVVVENVVEAAQWGPARDGSTFRWWLREWEKLGYQYRVLFLNAQFFPPCPQSRDRMYVVLYRGVRAPDLDYFPRAVCTSDVCQGALVDSVQTWKRPTKAWPLQEWGKYGPRSGQYLYTCPRCKAPVEPVAWPAYTAIDWSNLGPTIGDRLERGITLKDTTMERIRRSLMKFRAGPPVLIPTKAVWGVDRPVTQPMTSQTTQQDKALVMDAGVLPLRTHHQGISVDEQIRTIVAGNVGHALIVKNNGDKSEAKYRGQHIVDPFGALTAHPTQSLVFEHTPAVTEMRGGGSHQSGQHDIADVLHTVTSGGNHHGLITPGLFTKINGGPGDTAWHDTMTDPLGTVVSRGNGGTGLLILPWVEQWRSDPVAVTDQLATVMTHLRHTLASVPWDVRPVSDEDLLNVRFRMLGPDPELRRAMAFADSYILLGSNERQTMGLGNAVVPPVASWITGQCMAVLRGGGSGRPRRTTQLRAEAA